METVSLEGEDRSTMGVDINSHDTIIKEGTRETEAATPDSRPDRIIIPDPTSMALNSAFYGVYPRLLPILQRDNVRQFLCFCQKNLWAMAWDFITPQTLLHIILENSVRCAKVVLEGEAPELNGLRAYPNCATQYGFFPLHQAAEIFSTDMIKLLLKHGASTNVRTFGREVIEGLLPLHVAVENTSMHKYLDDNVFPDELHPNYWKADKYDIYKLIHLLCLPEMKIFLDTTRPLAKHTNDLVGEICSYIKGSYRSSGLIIIPGLFRYLGIVNKVYIQNQSQDPWAISRDESNEVSHEEVLEHVSSILKFYDFCPTGEGISIENLNLSPYNLRSPIIKERKKHGKTGKVAAGERVATRKDLPRSWDLLCKRKKFFPFWRSALALRFPTKIYPPHAIDDKHLRDVKTLCQSMVMDKGSSPTTDHNGLLASMPRTASNYQSKRLFSTAGLTGNYQSKRLFGTAALMLLKVLKQA